MAEGVALNAGNAGMRPATVPAAPSACLDSPLQPGGGKSAPLARRGVGDGGGAGGRGPYVHTPIGTSPPQVFEGRTIDGIERKRNRERFKHIAACAFALLHGGEEEAGKALLSCGRYFQRINFPCGTYKLVPFPCDSVFCPYCAARRSKPLQDRILARINQEEHDYFFLTVTVKSWEELNRAAIDRLVCMFRELRDSEEWRDAGISGGVYSIESTYTHAGWHPHIHVLIETKRGAFGLHHVERFKKRWLQITGDSHYINLKKMYGKTRKGRKTRRINHGALRELVKYATKSADFSRKPDRVLEFFHAFKGVRRMQSFGSFLGVAKEAEKEADEGHTKEPVGCSCGLCKWSDGKFIAKVHITDTILLADGSRQLKLFEPGAGPPELPAYEWIPEKGFQTREAKRMQPLLFVGPLFEGAYESF